MVAIQHNRRGNPLSFCSIFFLVTALCLLVRPPVAHGLSTNDQLSDPWSASSIDEDQSPVGQPDIIATHLSRAEYHLKVGAWPQATQNAQSVLAQEPENVKARAILGLIAALGGQQDKAEETLTFLAGKQATGMYAELIAAVLSGQKNNVEQAQDHLAKARTQEPDHPVILYYAGSLALAQGKLTEAEQAFQAALDKSPQFPPALAGLGQVYWRGKQADKAVAAYQRAIAAEPDTLLYRQQLIAIYKATGQKDAENKASRELLYFIPGIKERFLQQMMDLLNWGKNDEAIKQADTLLAVYQKFPVGHYIKAMAYINKGEGEAARKSLAALLSAGPRTVKTNHEAGLVYLTLGELDKAEEQFKLALALEPNNGRTFVFLPIIEQLRGHRDRALDGLTVMLAQKEPPALVHYLRANNFLAEDKMEEYQQEMQQGAALVPGLATKDAGIIPSSGDRVAVANNRNLMVLFFFNGWYEQAFRKSALVLKTNPSDPFALWYNALSSMIQKRYPEAVTNLNTLLEHAPDLAAAHMELGQAYKLMGKTSNALAAFKNAAALSPSPAPAYIAMGDLSMQTGNDADAIQSYRKAIEINPDTAHAYPPLALLLAEKPETIGDAMQLAQKAVALAPNSPAALDALGWVLVQQGHIKEGLEKLHRAHELSPRVPDVLYHLGVGYYKDNHPEKARQWLEAALAINQDFRGSDLAREIVKKARLQRSKQTNSPQGKAD